MDVKSFTWVRLDYDNWYREFDKKKYLDHNSDHISRKGIQLFLNDIIEKYSKKLGISILEFKPIFEKKNIEAYDWMSIHFITENDKYKLNSDVMKYIYSKLAIPVTNTEDITKLYNSFIKLSDWEKSKFLERIEPIKSKLEF